jgi:hypothetical protein
MSERGYVTTANARIEYHRNGVGGEGYYTIAFDSPEADPPILEVGQRMMAIVPSSAIHDEEGYLLPIISKGRSGRDQKTHIPELLVIDPAHVMPFATGEGCMGNWRGADHSSHLVMTILHEDARNRWPQEYEVGGRFFGVLPPLPMPEEQLAEALGAYGY